MKFDRKAVFDGLRADFGRLDDVQVSVVAELVAEFERRKLKDLRWLAYMLATAWHEARWKPMREIGRGKGKKYGKQIDGQVYYGRGLVQLTWLENYRELGRILNLPLVDNPDMALIVPVAVAILYEGMTTAISAKGDFTSHHLGEYFSATVDDPVNARRIINGTDKAKLIAGYHAKILVTLGHAVRLDVPAQKPAADVPKLEFPLPNKPPVSGKDLAGGAGAVVVTGTAAHAAGVHWLYIVLVLGALALAGLIGLIVYRNRS